MERFPQLNKNKRIPFKSYEFKDDDYYKLEYPGEYQDIFDDIRIDMNQLINKYENGINEGNNANFLTMYPEELVAYAIKVSNDEFEKKGYPKIIIYKDSFGKYIRAFEACLESVYTKNIGDKFKQVMDCNE